MPETADSASFVFEIPENLRANLNYKAGQFLNFQIPWKDFFIEHCYSLSSSPMTNTKMQVTVKRVAGGRASNWFNAGGSEITPILSLIQTALLTTDRPIQLIYANRDADSIIFIQTLDELAAEHGNQLNCHHHLDSEGAFLDKQKIEDLVAEGWDSDFYICGPDPFMDTVEAVLVDHKVDDSRIFIESFVSSIDPDRTQEQMPSEEESDIGDVKLKITADGKDFDVEYLS